MLPRRGPSDQSDTARPPKLLQIYYAYREAAGVNAFQINFHGIRDLGQLLDSMDCFMREVKPLVA